jgi:hypothetical protein
MEKPSAAAILKSLGRCRICRRRFAWLNNVPLYGYCWGTEKHPHRKVARLVPARLNPYVCSDNSSRRKR